MCVGDTLSKHLLAQNVIDWLIGTNIQLALETVTVWQMKHKTTADCYQIRSMCLVQQRMVCSMKWDLIGWSLLLLISFLGFFFILCVTLFICRLTLVTVCRLVWFFSGWDERSIDHDWSECLWYFLFVVVVVCKHLHQYNQKTITQLATHENVRSLL